MRSKDAQKQSTEGKKMAAAHFTTIPCEPRAAYEAQRGTNFFTIFVAVLRTLCSLGLKILKLLCTFLLDYEQSVFVPEILRVRNSVNIMQIRERNLEGMGRGRKKTVSFFFLFSAPALLAARGSPLTARSFTRRSFDRSKNARKRKRLLAVYVFMNYG